MGDSGGYSLKSPSGQRYLVLLLIACGPCTMIGSLVSVKASSHVFVATHVRSCFDHGQYLPALLSSLGAGLPKANHERAWLSTLL